MLELVKYIVNQFAENPDEIVYDVEETENGENITVTLSEADMGKVIGRQGKIAKAMRTLVKAVGMKENKKYNIEIKERQDA
ncbi:MAG: RNA-binding protein [Bacillota bacterium]|nr:MAG: RNA-binding protein [Bacillota bacterium]